MQARLHEENVEIESTIQITGNYSIQVPYKFIDCITSDIFNIPIIASDTKTYEASSLITWLEEHQTSPQFGSYELDKNVLIFNFDLYTEIREFFSQLLERDCALLNDGEHEEALQIIQKRVQGLSQNDEQVLAINRLCQLTNLKIQGLQLVLPMDPLEIVKPDNHQAILSQATQKDFSSELAVFWGVVGSNCLSYTFENFHFDITPYPGLDKVILTMAGAGIGTLSGMCIASKYSYNTFVAGVVLGMGAGAFNFALTNWTQVPHWSTPFISIPLFTAATFLPVVFQRCARNRFSFWHRESNVRETRSNEEQSMLRPPGNRSH